jgi:hypothetical protein
MSDVFEQVTNMDFFYGASQVGWLDNLHPEYHVQEGVEKSSQEFYPMDVTSEMYRGQNDEGVAFLGAISTKFIDSRFPVDAQFVDFNTSVGTQYTDLAQAEHVFGKRSKLLPLAQAMDIRLDSREDPDGTRSFAALLLADPKDINDRLELLGVADRTFVEYPEGRFDSFTFLRCLAQPAPELPLAAEPMVAVHDRAFHLLGHLITSPEVLQRIANKSRTLLETFATADAVIGGRPYYEFDGDEPSRYFQARKAMADFMGQLDFNLPNISFLFANGDTADLQKRVAFNLSELQIADKAETDRLAADTITWVAQLTKRVSSNSQL